MLPASNTLASAPDAWIEADCLRSGEDCAIYCPLLPCSYYIALPFTLLPTRAWKDLAWQDVQGLAMQGFAGNRFEMPSWRPLALAVESLPGVLTPIQALVGPHLGVHEEC